LDAAESPVAFSEYHLMSETIDLNSSRDRRARDGEFIEARNFIGRAEAAAKVAERFAKAVDVEGRFPEEAFAAIRAEKLLGVLIPTELGGEGARAADIADVCAILGAACGSTAMIFAMHQVKVACLVRHARGNAWQLDFQRAIAARQLLLASSTTEGANGGDIRSSEAAIRLNGPRVALVRDATCISYGAQADAIVTTARRADDAANSDQVLVVFRRDEYTLEPTKTWDTLGMRGTCGVGYMLRAEGAKDQVLAQPYDRIHSETMAPYAHLFWSVPARPRLREARFTQFRRPDAARGTAFDARARFARNPARCGSGGLGDMREICGGSGWTDRDGCATRAQFPQGRGIRTRGPDGDQRDARLWAVGISQR